MGLCAQWGDCNHVKYGCLYTIPFCTESYVVHGYFVVRVPTGFTVSYHTCASKNIEETMKKRKERRI